MKKKIFVADDDPLFQEFMVDMLTAMGYEALAFADGKKLMRHMAVVQPAAVFLDVYMPDMDGLEATTALKGLSQCPVVISMSSRPDYLSYAKRMGADAAVLKPLSPSEVERVLLSVGITP